MRVVVEVQLPGPDLGVVDALARLHLAARRCGGTARVSGADELLALVGLSEVLAPDREPEPEEQVGAEEVVHVDDPVF